LFPRRIPLLAAALFAGAALGAEEIVQSGVYEIAAQLVMPHLEENMRYAATRERRCIPGADSSAVFSVLRYESLAGCKLVDPDQRDGATHYALRCENPNGATGLARLESRANRISGVLEVKMGGKNMTFFQRVEGTRQGECARDSVDSGRALRFP
jgi:hypothetical protein